MYMWSVRECFPCGKLINVNIIVIWSDVIYKCIDLTGELWELNDQRNYLMKYVKYIALLFEVLWNAK